jgi:hypothetical protein
MPNESNLPEVATVLARTATGALLAGVTPSGALFSTGGVNGNGPVTGTTVTAQSLNGSGTAPTVGAGANAGTGATVGSQLGHDLGGSFVLTAGTTPAAGALATVTFGTALAAAPAAVLVTCWDQTSAAGVAVGVTSVSGTGFTVSGPAPTAAHHLLVSYAVIAS